MKSGRSRFGDRDQIRLALLLPDQYVSYRIAYSLPPFFSVPFFGSCFFVSLSCGILCSLIDRQTEWDPLPALAGIT
jgi:hypothetical protein